MLYFTIKQKPEYMAFMLCYAGKVLNNLLSYPDDVLKIAIYAAHMAQVRSAGSEAGY